MHGTSALSYWLLALRWFPLFISDRDTTEDDPQTGKPPSTSNEKAVDTVRCLISLDARYPVEELAMFSWIKSSVVFTIIKQQLKLCKICARLVTHLLVSRSRTVDYVRQLLEKYEHFDQRRVHEIVTGDETCICCKKNHYIRRTIKYASRKTATDHKLRGELCMRYFWCEKTYRPNSCTRTC